MLANAGESDRTHPRTFEITSLHGMSGNGKNVVQASNKQ